MQAKVETGTYMLILNSIVAIGYETNYGVYKRVVQHAKFVHLFLVPCSAN